MNQAPGRIHAPDADLHLQRLRTVMNTGAVKFYSDQKGFGFIRPANGSKDVFVRATTLERAGTLCLVEGQKVAFDAAEERHFREVAVNNTQVA
jgi:CspA family cold shock protein